MENPPIVFYEAEIAASTISQKDLAEREAPPINPPSTSGWAGALLHFPASWNHHTKYEWKMMRLRQTFQRVHGGFPHVLPEPSHRWLFSQCQLPIQAHRRLPKDRVNERENLQPSLT